MVVDGGSAAQSVLGVFLKGFAMKTAPFIAIGAALLLATTPGAAHAGSLVDYRKAACSTAEDFAGCVANKKPQMFRGENIRWDCRHGFSLIANDNNLYPEIGDEEVEFITTIIKTPTYK